MTNEETSLPALSKNLPAMKETELLMGHRGAMVRASAETLAILGPDTTRYGER